MVQVLELHFNPPKRKDKKAEIIFDSFCYEPENVYEKRLGSLYMIGELKNVLPLNYQFLDNLAKIIKGSFYGFPVQSPEKSFKESLKQANEFLEKEVEKNNTRWMGNLNFAVLSLKEFGLNFTKVGDIKILLLREGQVINIGKELELEGIEPYPLKIFSNVVFGKFSKNDVILVATKEVFSVFTQGKEKPITDLKEKKQIIHPESLIYKIANLLPFETKTLKKILKERDEQLSEISGACLLIVLKPEILSKKALSFEKETPFIPWKEVFKPFSAKIKKFSNILQKLSSFKPEIRLPSPFKNFKLPRPISPERKVKDVTNSISKKFSDITNNIRKIKSSQSLKKKLALILVLISFLAIGWFIFKPPEKVTFEKAKQTFPQVQEKIDMAENFLILKQPGRANSILQEAWQEVAPLAEEGSPTENEAKILKETIEQKLFTLNQLTEIKQPELLLEFPEKEFQPQKIVNIDRILYFLNAYSKGVYKFAEGEKIKIDTDKEFNLFVPLDEESVLLFTKPDKITFLSKDQLGQTISLKLSYPDFICNDLSSFSKNIYLLDSRKGEIIKYSTPLVINKDFPQRWLAPETERITNAKSIAIDGGIWVLTPGNKLERYYLGKYQKSLDLNIFPLVQNIDKILINRNLPYLFLLEPAQNRVIILDKEGQIIKQFQSEKFDDLKDFAVSDQGTIYLLNGRKVYQIKF